MPNIPFLTTPSCKYLECIIPKRINLDRFAATRRYHPVAHLRIHPRELITFGALREQAVAWIDMNVEASTPQMMLGDIDQDRQQQVQSGPIIGVMQVTTKRVKKPQSRVGGVIKSFLFPIGKHVWDESIANVM